MGKILDRFNAKRKRGEVILVGSHEITLRTFRQDELYWAYDKAQPIIEVMLRLMEENSGAISPVLIHDLFTHHPEIWFELISKVSGKSPEFFYNMLWLNAITILAEFWDINRAFFLNGAATLYAQKNSILA